MNEFLTHSKMDDSVRHAVNTLLDPGVVLADGDANWLEYWNPWNG